MFTFAVVFLAWCVLSVPIGVLVGHIAAANERRRVPMRVQNVPSRRAA